SAAVTKQIPMENPPEVLAAKARQIAKSLGYTQRPIDAAYGWDYNRDYLRYIIEQKDASTGLSRIKTNQPPAVFFWYRESPRYLVSPTGRYITRSQPNKFERGMLEDLLDSDGLL